MSEKRYREIRPIIIKEFLKLLKQYNAINEFRKNTIKAILEYPTVDTNPIALYINPLATVTSMDCGGYGYYYETLLSNSFTWSETEEGYDVWSHIDKKWQKKLFDLKFEYDDEGTELPF